MAYGSKFFNGQSGQDRFILSVLNNKTNGYFLEIGTNDPVKINNSYILENMYGWNGLMVEYEDQWEPLYKAQRTSHYVIQDARTVDYAGLFKKYNFPKSMDYLQVDLEVSNGSTIETLEVLDKTLFPDYKFSVVTFEHDIYAGDCYNTRAKSREIFERNGYVRVFSDIQNGGNAYEDWYVYPSQVDMNYINTIKSDISYEWTDIMKILR
jgi:hypothetical protein